MTHPSSPAEPGQRAVATLSIAYLPIDQLRPDPGNARQHSAKQVRQIAKSIETFGFNVPLLVDAECNVIAGHGRLLAAKRLGWHQVPTIRLDHLSEAQKRAFMIADNRLAEVAVWDDRLLAAQLKALASVELNFDIETIGFDMARSTSGSSRWMRQAKKPKKPNRPSLRFAGRRSHGPATSG